MYAFNTVVLYQTDLDSLLPFAWITDSVLEFWFEYLSRHHSHIGYIGPSVVHLIRDSCHNIPIDFLELISVSDILFVPINDHQGEDVGGSHWSLAVYIKHADEWFYIDSAVSKRNLNLAENTCKIIQTKTDKFKFRSVDISQQRNNYDCGLYVILISEMLTRVSINELPRDINFDSNYTRSRILDLIKSQANAKKN